MAQGNPEAAGFGEWLRTNMAAAGINQAELGRRLGTAKQNVSQWHSGSNAPNPNTAIRIADALHASRAEALRAIGLDVVADAMDEASPVDPFRDQINRIMGDERRSIERRIEMVRKLRLRAARIVDYMLEDVDTDINTGDPESPEPGDQANTA